MRYRLIIDFADESGSSPFIVWDKECRQIIGKTAAEVVECESNVSNLYFSILNYQLIS